MGPVTVVFDTNVLVSALGFGGTPLRALLHAIDADDIRIVASPATVGELLRVMDYDRLPFEREDKVEYWAILGREVDLVTPPVDIDAIDDDPDDNMFLECAVTADADYIVSGDRHLKDLGSFRGIEMCSPAEFLQRRSSEDEEERPR